MFTYIWNKSLEFINHNYYLFIIYILKTHTMYYTLIYMKIPKSHVYIPTTKKIGFCCGQNKFCIKLH